MATLTGRAPKDTYKDLLQVSNANNGVDTTVRNVEDGEATASALQLSTTIVRINGLLDGAAGATFDWGTKSFKLDTILESTSAAGVTIDSVLLKDNTVKAGTLTIGAGSITDSSGAITFGNENLSTTGSFSIASMGGNWTNAGRTVADMGIVTTMDLNGGTIDGTTIGGSAVAAGSFTAIVGTTATLSGILSVDDATDSTSTGTGSIHTDGGLGVVKQLRVGGSVTLAGIVSLDNTTESTSTTTGSFHTDGGAGVAKTIVAGLGIKLGGTDATNLLDNYKSPTAWTPTFETDGTDATSITYIEQFGRYIRIGDMVTIWWTLRISAVTLGPASGNLQIGGLPFAGSSVHDLYGGNNVVAGWATGNTPRSFKLSASASEFLLLDQDDTTSFPIPITDLSGDESIHGSFTYFV